MSISFGATFPLLRATTTVPSLNLFSVNQNDIKI